MSLGLNYRFTINNRTYTLVLGVPDHIFPTTINHIVCLIKRDLKYRIDLMEEMNNRDAAEYLEQMWSPIYLSGVISNEQTIELDKVMKIMSMRGERIKDYTAAINNCKIQLMFVKQLQTEPPRFSALLIAELNVVKGETSVMFVRRESYIRGRYIIWSPSYKNI